jgi:DNA-binding GntR family transcriptional regulator
MVTRKSSDEALGPLPEALQLGARVHQALVESIVAGRIASGTQLRPDVIARQLEVSTTPVREAMHRLETDGLAVKLPYQGWFVREFTEEQIRHLYEFRTALECLSVRLACERISEDDIRQLQRLQTAGEAALAASDVEAYRDYNRELHASILRSANNSYLSNAMGQVALQSEMLTGKTIRIVGRPLRAIEEHSRLIEHIAKRDAQQAVELMRFHIMSALDDILRWNVQRVQDDEATAGGGSGDLTR